MASHGMSGLMDSDSMAGQMDSDSDGPPGLVDSSASEDEPQPETVRTRLRKKTRPQPETVRIVRKRSSDIKGEAIGVDRHFYRRTKKLKLPWWLLAMVGMLAASPNLVNDSDLDHMEFFVGVKSIHKAFTNVDKFSGAYDIKDDSVCVDINGDMGWLHALQFAPALEAIYSNGMVRDGVQHVGMDMQVVHRAKRT